MTTLSLRHAAICVTDIARATKLFCEVLGFKPYHTTDADWAMLHSEGTTLSLVRVRSKQPTSMGAAKGSHPAHLGLVAKSIQDVEHVHTQLKALGHLVVGTVQSHRDGSRGFYFQDDDGNQFECIYIPYQGQNVPRHQAKVLIAHGSRDSRWRAPLEQLAQKVREHAMGQPVALCYMEFCEPTLEAQVSKLYADGIRSFEVVPVFLSSGAHVAEDIPQLVQACRQKFTDAIFEVRPALGEDAAVMEAMAAAIIG